MIQQGQHIFILIFPVKSGKIIYYTIFDVMIWLVRHTLWKCSLVAEDQRKTERLSKEKE